MHSYRATKQPNKPKMNTQKLLEILAKMYIALSSAFAGHMA